ncbi:DUF1177 domain-containing protein [Cytobacillus sp.]|uniref:DUF1177 domain-containing protein n=1 Tax=Cytobacillus sp. TaxID=2675269 RepID=UPI0028BF1967|nr:DUF1177 domain-containing protein [Cytobacillus sp.]
METEKKIRGDFIDELLSGLPLSKQVIINKGNQLGFKPELKWEVAIVESESETISSFIDKVSLLINQESQKVHVKSHVHRQGDKYILLLASQDLGQEQNPLEKPLTWKEILTPFMNDWKDIRLGLGGETASALKLADMQIKGDTLLGDVLVTTHICPNAPTLPHDPVDFMDSPVDILTMNKHEVLPEMEVILSIDTTKGNRVVNHKGIAISPTVKEGYILRVSDDLLRIMEMSTGQLPVTFPITTQDITPYGNGVYHINSILQPAVATDSPVVGVAITAQSIVPGCGTGASHETDIADAVRFAVEVAKEATNGTCEFYSKDEFKRITELYGSMKVLQTLGQKSAQQ